MPLTVEEFRRRVEALERIEFPPGTDDAERTIPAKWIKELFPEPQRVATHPIRIQGAIIEGDLNLRYARAPYEIEMKECDFTGTLVLAGLKAERIVNLSGSRLRGAVNFRFAHVVNYLSLSECVCDSKADFNDMSARNFSASGTRFRGPFMIERATIGGVFLRPHLVAGEMQPTRFDDTARFHGLHAQYLDAKGAQFGKDAHFERLTVDGVAWFRAAEVDDDLNPIDLIVSRFGGNVNFRNARFGREVDFSGAYFVGRANFHSARTAGRFIMRGAWGDPWKYPTRFDGYADFTGLEVGETLSAAGCHFMAECSMFRIKAATVDFSATVDGKRVTSSFDGPFWFNESEVSGSVTMIGATFRGPARFPRVHIGGTLFLPMSASTPGQERTVFHDEVDFFRLRVDGDLWCEGAEFKGFVNAWLLRVGGILGFTDETNRIRYRATFADRVRLEGAQVGDFVADGIRFPKRTTFREMHVDRTANLEGAAFEGDIDFRGANVAGKLTLENVAVAGDLILRDARAGAFVAPQALAKDRRFDGRGFTFGRIDGDVRQLLQRQEPYDLRLYEQAERFVRDSGHEEMAGALYLDRRRRETRAYWNAFIGGGSTKRFTSLLLAAYGVIQDLLFRYGVRPLRLLGLSLFVVLFGAWVFSREGAVRPKERDLKAETLTISQALGYSARTFIPIGDLPSGSQLIATDNTLPGSTLTFEGYAAIQRLLGLVLVPLGIAAVTGLLVRKR